MKQWLTKVRKRNKQGLFEAIANSDWKHVEWSGSQKEGLWKDGSENEHLWLKFGRQIFNHLRVKIISLDGWGIHLRDIIMETGCLFWRVFNMHRLTCIGKRKPVTKTMYQKLETRVLAKRFFPFLIYVLGELNKEMASSPHVEEYFR